MELLRCDRRGYQLISPRKTVPCWQAEGISRTGLEEVFRAELTGRHGVFVMVDGAGRTRVIRATAGGFWREINSGKTRFARCPRKATKERQQPRVSPHHKFSRKQRSPTDPDR